MAAPASPTRLPSAHERRERVEGIASSWHQRAHAKAQGQGQGQGQFHTHGSTRSSSAVMLQKIVPSLRFTLAMLAPASPASPSATNTAGDKAQLTGKRLKERTINISEDSSTNLMHSIRTWRYKRQLYEAVRLLAQCSPQPDSLVVHRETFDKKLVQIAASGGAPSAFCAVDATKLIERWADFRFRSFGEVETEVRVHSTGDYVLMCLMSQLHVALRVENPSDVAVVQRTLGHTPHKLPKGTDTINSNTPFSKLPHAFGTNTLFIWDACVVRSPNHITASLRAGVRTFLIDDVDEAVRIQHAYKRLELIGPLGFVILLNTQLSKPQANSAAIPYMYGCSSQRLPTVASKLRSIQAAVMGVCGRVDDAALISATLHIVGDAVEVLSSCAHNIQFVSLHGDSMCAAISNLDVIRSFRAKHRITHLVCDATHYLFEGSHTIVARVIGNKPAYDEEGRVCGQQYFIDDGCYGSFSRTTMPSDVTSGMVSTPKLNPCPTPLVRAPGSTASLGANSESTVWGQTCDSIDCVVKQTRLPPLGSGSWVAFSHMEEACGTHQTCFNGFEPPNKRYFVRLG